MRWAASQRVRAPLASLSARAASQPGYLYVLHKGLLIDVMPGGDGEGTVAEKIIELADVNEAMRFPMVHNTHMQTTQAAMRWRKP
mmetsp:Transcript_137871/g.274890  ORF Transcript_137871/g.274890 Transcript_137871/m.274890 type:complete len:85 (+) Transcript_137871:736-990(+)